MRECDPPNPPHRPGVTFSLAWFFIGLAIGILLGRVMG